MKIIFITLVTPYKENMGGPSGHPYHLMIERPAGIDITIYSFNSNKLSADTIADVEKELNVTIKVLQIPKWLSWILKLHLTILRIFLHYPINYYYRIPQTVVNEIKSIHPDGIWVYGQEFSGIIKQFSGYKRVHSLPDCYCLHWYRRLGLRQTLKNWKEFISVSINYQKYYHLESEYSDDSDIVYHLVGEEDARFLNEINPKINTRFICHPLYKSSEEGPLNEIKTFHSPIKLLIAGRYDIYSYEAGSDLIDELSHIDPDLRGKFQITILGKGWENKFKQLQSAGWNVEWINFVPDYLEEIRKHDIQLNPLSLGTGTKGKVLDAISNGLLEIGTPYALENIKVATTPDDKHGAICYSSSKEILSVLNHIANDKLRYENIAQQGLKQVSKTHNRTTISKQLFELFNT